MTESPMMVWAVVVVAVQIAVVFGAVLLERRDPTATLAWILVIALLPVVGTFAYLLFGRRRARITRRRLARIDTRMRSAMESGELAGISTTMEADDFTDPRSRGLVRLAGAGEDIWWSEGNAIEILDGAAATYRSFLVAFDEAHEHIHLLFYIFRADDTGRMILERLTAAVERGVKVRLLVDAVGSAGLSDEDVAPLLRAGGQVARYGAWRLSRLLGRSDRLDYRNHRKIVVVDGQVGFTGGINIGREYLGFTSDEKSELWRDTHLAIRGPAAAHLQWTFISDWALSTQDLPAMETLFPLPERPGDERVLVVPSGPDQVWTPLRRMLTHSIAQATEKVYVTSPYFVPDRPFRDAMISAALRGVDVRVLVPEESDHWIVGLAALGSFERLIEAGVQIYRYDKGFIHAKTLVIDDWFASVGSANMDSRSFHLNFELNVFVFGSAFSKALTDQFLLDLHDLSPLTVDVVRGQSYGRRMLGAIARLASPLL